MSQIVLYGMPNCDTVKRARQWLAAQGRPARFHDLRRDGLDLALLQTWLVAAGWERVLNRRGTTWRGLSLNAQAAVRDGASAAAVMLAEPALIRRPVVCWPNDAITVGFDEADWRWRLG